MSTNQELHVIFGTGPSARAIMQELVKQGKVVRMVNRSGQAPEIPQGVEVVKADAYDVAQTKALCQGAKVVYQCAQPAYYEWVEKFPPLQASILEGAAANQAVLAVVENLYMYGDVQGKLQCEDMPYGAKTRKGKVRAQMSEDLMKAHQAGKVRVVMGRGADFFGPWVLESALGEREIYPILAGKKVSSIGDLDQPHTFTYIEDFGRSMVKLGATEAAYGKAWHVPNLPPLTMREWLTLVYKATGNNHPPAIGKISKTMLRIFGALFSKEAGEVVEMYYQFTQPFLVDHSQYTSMFGEDITPLDEAIARTLAWYRNHPHP